MGAKAPPTDEEVSRAKVVEELNRIVGNVRTDEDIHDFLNAVARARLTGVLKATECRDFINAARGHISMVSIQAKYGPISLYRPNN